jgi:N-acetylornithine carbamoyltransferase
LRILQHLAAVIKEYRVLIQRLVAIFYGNDNFRPVAIRGIGTMKHFVSLTDRSADELNTIVQRAGEIKGGSEVSALKGRLMAQVFFNPSLRTRVSFEAALARFGGTALTLTPGAGTWGLETDDGVIMRGENAEHIKEAAPVLSSYVDVLGVRSFSKLQSLEEDLKDSILKTFVECAKVPVISLESAVEHPCQALADMLTINEALGKPAGRKFVLSWAPHIKPLPLSVPHSALLAAAFMGMEVVLAHPPGYDLAPVVVQKVSQVCKDNAVDFKIVNEQRQAVQEADVVYAKSWGAPILYSNFKAQEEDFLRYCSWWITKEKLPPESVLMHCLPVRRNVVISDDALDSPQSVVIQQAENRMWAQAALLEEIFS